MYLAEATNSDNFSYIARMQDIMILRLRQSTPGVYSYENFRARHNGNGVNMDAEQASLAENTIYYNALIDRVSGKLSTLNTVIKGGR